MSHTDRILVLTSSRGSRKYPLPAGAELKDEYELAGVRWTVTAVLATEDIEAPIPELTRQTR